MRTKKNYWFTVSESTKSLRNEVPQYWKEAFANKKITCGGSFMLNITRHLITFDHKKSNIKGSLLIKKGTSSSEYNLE